MNKNPLQAFGYRFRGRFKMALGYLLLFMGRSILRLSQVMQGFGGRKVAAKAKKTPLQRVVGVLAQYAGVVAIVWFFLGGRNAAYEQGFFRWLLSVSLGIAIYNGFAWCFNRLRRRREPIETGSV